MRPKTLGPMIRLTLCVLALVLLPGAVNAVAWDPPREGLQPVPALSARVTDVTGTLSAGERQARRVRRHVPAAYRLSRERCAGLANAWAYVRAHREEINKQIEENEAA